MPPRRRPAAVLAANNHRSHRSQAEIAERARNELHVPCAELEPPSYLVGAAREEFLGYRDMMLSVNEEYGQHVYCDMDADMLAAYVLEHGEYLAAVRDLHDPALTEAQRRHALASKKAAFAHMCRCSALLGLAVTDRLRLVFPGREEDDDDPLPDM